MNDMNEAVTEGEKKLYRANIFFIEAKSFNFRMEVRMNEGMDRKQKLKKIFIFKF